MERGAACLNQVEKEIFNSKSKSKSETLFETLLHEIHKSVIASLNIKAISSILALAALKFWKTSSIPELLGSF